MLNLFKKDKKNSKHFQTLSEQLEKRKSIVLEEFKGKHKEAISWAKKKGIKPSEIAQKGAKGLAVTVATSAMVLSAGVAPSGQLPSKELEVKKEINRQVAGSDVEVLIKARKDVSPQVKKALSRVNLYDEKKIEKQLSKILKVPVKAQLDGIRLNATYGIMGYESHLARFPGDNLSTHFQSEVEYKRFAKASMAGGPGAWGYIAPSQKDLTSKDIEKEKYYLVAQTFLSPNWGTSQAKDWFRHRKMVVVNPQNGRVAIGVLEDAGPEKSTGRAFGGSPEIFEELDLFNSGPRVLMYFVDDPKDNISLGRYGI
ncbi:MAG: hypothetical protein A2Z11_01370 [Candidatus Woykebacteria bacterium RBG_16_43_9]|uniref:Uncharacterized protein n=1 Tax=Candidatus Woykebacteria bacterium RBG_16_43_9 TaxID=1802596 RepID=A0A1G1WCW4_9BACT|nr:MAG: hypothetical protein A2Z11_01370 [Candidatus Woykebacteria bacterium RBG_16_43_9]